MILPGLTKGDKGRGKKRETPMKEGWIADEYPNAETTITATGERGRKKKE